MLGGVCPARSCIIRVFLYFTCWCVQRWVSWVGVILPATPQKLPGFTPASPPPRPNPTPTPVHQHPSYFYTRHSDMSMRSQGLCRQAPTRNLGPTCPMKDRLPESTPKHGDIQRFPGWKSPNGTTMLACPPSRLMWDVCE